jgi:hypothetical protein
MNFQRAETRQHLPAFPPVSAIVKHAELRRAIAARKWRRAYLVVRELERMQTAGAEEGNQ